MARDAEEPLDRVEEPGLAAHREVEPRVAVGDDVEAGLLLLPDDAAHGVQVLLAEARVAERFLEGPPPQHLGEPRRPRPGAGDGRRQREIARRVEHGSAPPPAKRATGPGAGVGAVARHGPAIDVHGAHASTLAQGLQRILAGKDQARTEGRPVRDGEIMTACQQTCPTRAITFGDLKDGTSRVSSLSTSARGYHVLEDLGTRPAVTYLKKIEREGPV